MKWTVQRISIATCWGLGIQTPPPKVCEKNRPKKHPAVRRYIWRMSIGSFTRQWLTKDLFSFFTPKPWGKSHPIGRSQCFFNRVAKNHQLLLYFWEVFNRHLPLCYQLFVGFNKRFKPHNELDVDRTLSWDKMKMSWTLGSRPEPKFIEMVVPS